MGPIHPVWGHLVIFVWAGIAAVSKVCGCKKYPHAPNFNVEQNAPKHKHKKNKNDASIEIGGLGVSL